MHAYVVRKKGSKEPPVTVTQTDVILQAIESAHPGDLLEILITELNAPTPQLQLLTTEPKKQEKPK